VTEVAGKADQTDRDALLVEGFDQVARAVAAAVVDEDDFDADVGVPGEGAESFHGFGDDIFFVVAGNNDGNAIVFNSHFFSGGAWLDSLGRFKNLLVATGRRRAKLYR
jgi:hypothetical protein